MDFDPSAAARPDSGVFGLPHTVDEAKVALLPVPFDATASYAKGAAAAPLAILEASKQVDLFDLEVGKPYESGISMVRLPPPIARGLAQWNREAGRLAEPIIAAGGDVQANRKLQASLRRVNDLCARVNSFVYINALELLRRGKIVGVVGGDHSTPLGSIRAHSETYPGLGILHLDAHADLRQAFEGFTWSHASVMYNALALPGVARLVQVGLRDLCQEEHDRIRVSRGRVVAHFDPDLARAQLDGASWRSQCARIIRDLPREVYLSFDIDGLEPSLCPHTGTPVPGGLGFYQASLLLGAVAQSGRRIVGFDLTEVAPGEDEWDANVGARMLYKLIGWTLTSVRRAKRR